MVVFPDETVYPYSAVVRIVVTWGDGTRSSGSGVFVGPNDILTASHVVARGNENPTDVDVYPAYDVGPGPYGSFTVGRWVTNYWTVDQDRDGLITSNEAAFDLALIGISQPLGDAVGWLGMTSNAGGGVYTILGYPAEQNGHQTSDSGYAAVNFYNAFDIGAIYHAAGSSGGPIVSDTGHVVGVVSTAGWGSRIDTEWNDLIAWMTQNDSLLPGPPQYVLQVARLYEAGLNRAPDASGLNFWIDRFEAGSSLVDLSTAFLDSQEFTSRYGDDDNMSANRFIEVMYMNVIDRLPDSSGYAFWVGEMNRGLSRENALIQFSESGENIAASRYLEQLHDSGGGYWIL